MIEFFVLLASVAVAWLWHDSLGAREAAVSAARAACAAEGLMFLDDTVGITSLRPARDDEGRLKLQRAYDFEYSDTGNNRINGSVVMLGDRVILLNVGLRVAPPAITLH
jgi:hypothetical protein